MHRYYEAGPAVREAAAGALASIGKDAADAIPGLIEAMRVEESTKHHQSYIEALVAIGPKAIPSLVQALGTPEANLRIGAVDALGRLGPELASAVPGLIKALDDGTEFMRGPADSRTIGGDIADLMVKLGPRAAPMLVDAVKDQDLSQSIRIRAAIVLTRIGADVPDALIQVLVGGLSQPRLRDESADALGRLAPLAGGAIPALATAAKQEESYHAAAALAKISPSHEVVGEALKTLESRLSHEEWRERFDAIRALRLFDSRSVPLLMTAIRDTDPLVRQLAIGMLGDIGPPAQAAVPPLIEALNVEGLDHDDTTAIVRALRKIGLDRKSAIEAASILLDLLRAELSASEDVAGVLGQIGRDVVPNLIGILADDKAGTIACINAIAALGKIGPGASDAVPYLIEALQHSGAAPSLHRELIQTLGSIGPAANPAVPELLEATRVESDTAVQALIRIGDPALPVLMKTLKDGDSDLQEAALRVVAGLGAKASDASPVLIELARKADPTLRVLAITALGQVGRGDENVEAVLIQGLRDPRQRIRAAACEALGKIRPLSTATVCEKLTAALEDDALLVRLKAAEALGESAQAASCVLPDLERVARSEPYETVRFAVREAISRIQSHQSKIKQ
ncbi:HEAT repeat domain-containing protein [Singulisphaera sp. PoT]|uniref:HEAT repeat domain-containing protein n=1 Tax=Singulisphaera sp. PoT TaxID=3411797 RepID=UPI003BF56664